MNAELQNSAGLYKGSFVDGAKDGKGKFEYTEKYQYIGSYSKNQKSGQGTLFNPGS